MTAMAEENRQPARLYLVTPAEFDPASLPSQLEAALGAGDIAAVLIAAGGEEHEMAAIAERLVPLIQDHGAAALIENHTRIAGRTGADGVHVSGGFGELKTVLERFRPQKIVGAGALSGRHAAMQAGEAGADYVFFGKPHGDIRPEPHPKNIALAQWWCALVEVPAVVMAGSAIASVAEAAATGAEFVALHRACWAHPGGPAEGIAMAAEIISSAEDA